MGFEAIREEIAINDQNVDNSEIRLDLIPKVKKGLFIIKIIFIILATTSISIFLFSYFMNRAIIPISLLPVIIGVPITVICWFIYLKRISRE